MVDGQCRRGEPGYLPFKEPVLWILILFACGVVFLLLFILRYLVRMKRALLCQQKQIREGIAANSSLKVTHPKDEKEWASCENQRAQILETVEKTNEKVSQVQNTQLGTFFQVTAAIGDCARNLENQTTQLRQLWVNLSLDLDVMDQGTAELRETLTENMKSLTESVERLLEMSPERHLSRRQ